MTTVAFLVASPTRSSYVCVCALAALADTITGLNADDSPLSLLRPWQLAESVQCPTQQQASSVAATVSKASGFRARLLTMRGLKALPIPALPNVAFDPSRAIDGLTYANVEVVNPADPTRTVLVRALVDTGSTDCELRGEQIEELGLRPEADTAVFETAAGIQCEAPLYRATIRVMGREASCLLSPAEKQADDDEEEDDEEEDELDATFGFSKVSDDALLGHDALAALGLAVDCRERRLLALPGVDPAPVT